MTVFLLESFDCISMLGEVLKVYKFNINQICKKLVRNIIGLKKNIK